MDRYSNPAEALRARGGKWWVIEKEPETLLKEEMPHYISAGEAGPVLLKADIISLTGMQTGLYSKKGGN